MCFCWFRGKQISEIIGKETSRNHQVYSQGHCLWTNVWNAEFFFMPQLITFSNKQVPLIPAKQLFYFENCYSSDEKIKRKKNEDRKKTESSYSE